MHYLSLFPFIRLFEQNRVSIQLAESGQAELDNLSAREDYFEEDLCTVQHYAGLSQGRLGYSKQGSLASPWHSQELGASICGRH